MSDDVKGADVGARAVERVRTYFDGLDEDDVGAGGALLDMLLTDAGIDVDRETLDHMRACLSRDIQRYMDLDVRYGQHRPYAEGCPGCSFCIPQPSGDTYRDVDGDEVGFGELVERYEAQRDKIASLKKQLGVAFADMDEERKAARHEAAIAARLRASTPDSE